MARVRNMTSIAAAEVITVDFNVDRGPRKDASALGAYQSSVRVIDSVVTVSVSQCNSCLARSIYQCSNCTGMTTWDLSVSERDPVTVRVNWYCSTWRGGAADHVSSITARQRRRRRKRIVKTAPTATGNSSDDVRITMTSPCERCCVGLMTESQLLAGSVHRHETICCCEKISSLLLYSFIQQRPSEIKTWIKKKIQQKQKSVENNQSENQWL